MQVLIYSLIQVRQIYIFFFINNILVFTYIRGPIHLFMYQLIFYADIREDEAQGRGSNKTDYRDSSIDR